MAFVLVLLASTHILIAYGLASLPCVKVPMSSPSMSIATGQTRHCHCFCLLCLCSFFEGVEFGGALKNVLAIACGISDGLEMGANARAALITRGMMEITLIAVAKGGNPLTMGGLAGIGDIVLTCTGEPRSLKWGRRSEGGRGIRGECGWGGEGSLRQGQKEGSECKWQICIRGKVGRVIPVARLR